MKWGNLVAIGALIVIFCGTVLAMPATAYSIRIQEDDKGYAAILSFSDDEKKLLFKNPGPAAKAVIEEAEAYGAEIKRSEGSIRGEIRAHALAWIVGERVHSNPMNIELYSASFWSYLFD